MDRRKKKSLVGWTFKEFFLKWRSDGEGAVGSRIYKNKKDVLYKDFLSGEKHPYSGDRIKVRISIEELDLND